MHSCVLHTEAKKTWAYRNRNVHQSDISWQLFHGSDILLEEWRLREVSPLTEQYKIRVKSILDSSSSQKGLFSVPDIVDVMLRCWEETVLSVVIRYLAPLPKFLQTVEQNSFSGEPQLLKIISKGIKCTAILYIKPLPLKPAILIIFSYQPTMTSDIYCWFLSSVYFLSN